MAASKEVNYTQTDTDMKKSIILALALAVPAMAGEKSAPVTVVDVPAPAACPFGVEIAGVWTSPIADAIDPYHNVQTWGVDLTGVYELNSNWSVTLRFGWANGENTVNHAFEMEATNWTIMPGVRYTAPINDKLSWYAGANVGVGRFELEEDFYGDDYTAFEVGFCYSAELGLRYDINEKVYVFGAVQCNGTTATPANADVQFGAGVRAGLGFDF